MAIYSLGSKTPEIHPEAYVHPDSTVIGDVAVGPGSSIWPHAVIRGDYGKIRIGAQTSIQDGTVIHATSELATVIGSRCVVGHLAHLEGCTIEDDVLVGSGAIVLHRAIIRSHALVGANALITNATSVPSYAMALGVPARIYPDRVTEGQFEASVANYVANASFYRDNLKRID